MPQNQFDKWLRDKVNPYDSNGGLDQEWSKLQSRMDDDKKRRPFLFWIWTSAAIAGLVMIINFVSWQASSEHPSIANKPQEPAIENTVQNKGLTSDFITQSKVRTTVGNELTKTHSQALDQDQSTIRESKKSSTNIAISNLSLAQDAGINNSAIKEKNETLVTTRLINENKIAIRPESHKLEDQNWDDSIVETKERTASKVTTFIIKPINGLVWTHTLDKNLNTQTNKFHHSWHFELAAMSGATISTFKTSDSKSEVEAIRNVETAKESFNIELRAFKGLGNGWWLGSGVHLGYNHIVSEQRFIDTVSGDIHNQIVKIREDSDGNRMDIVGTVNGKTIYHIDRTRHQIHARVSIPVIVKYDHNLTKNWFVSTELGFVSTIYNYRKGKSIISNEQDILEMELSDRYDTGFRGGILAGASINYQLNRQLNLSLGVQGQKEVFGSKSLSGSWTHQLSDVGGRIGLRYTY